MRPDNAADNAAAQYDEEAKPKKSTLERIRLFFWALGTTSAILSTGRDEHGRDT